jgi:hypothetical protein
LLLLLGRLLVMMMRRIDGVCAKEFVFEKEKETEKGGGGTQDWGYATAIAAAAAASLDKSKRDYYEYKCGGGISLDVRNARREIALMTISKTV